MSRPTLSSTRESARQAKSGFNYFMEGFHLIRRPGLRTFVFIPLMINLLLFAGAFYVAFGQLEQLFAYIKIGRAHV